MNSNLPSDEGDYIKIFLAFSMMIFLFVCAVGLLFLSSCSAIPDAFKTADDVFDDAIKVTVDKSALQQHTDLNVYVEIKNKEEK